MRKLPDHSEANSVSGIWFVFPDEVAIIKVWLSTMTGKEKVYANEALVYETRNIHKFATHYDIDYAGHQYEVEILTRNIMTFTIACNLFREGRLVGAQFCGLDSFGVFKVQPAPDTTEIQMRALSRYRSRAQVYLQEFDLQEARHQYEWILSVDDEDAEAHFYLACIASLEEDTDRAFHHLAQALHYGLSGLERIRSVDYLAYLRVQPAFERFCAEYAI